MATANKNRKAAEASILSDLEEILPGSANVNIYKRRFLEMTDAEFEQMILRIEAGEFILPIIAPEAQAPAIDVGRNIDTAKRWGVKLFERVWMDGQYGADPYLSNDEYLIVLMPLKRQAQFLTKKISIPEDSRTIDNMTGQVTGRSKGSKISYVEMQVLNSQDLRNSIMEFQKPKGGDLTAYNAMAHSLTTTGGASLTSLNALGSRARSIDSLSIHLTTLHLKNTL